MLPSYSCFVCTVCRQAVEPQFEAGLHSPQQAGHQERPRPQARRPGETLHYAPLHCLRVAKPTVSFSSVDYRLTELTSSCFCVCCLCVFDVQVALVYPNNDPGMFWVAFYGCLLAEVIPVPIEVPLTRKVPAHVWKILNTKHL